MGSVGSKSNGDITPNLQIAEVSTGISYANCFDKKTIQSGSNDVVEKPRNGDRVSIKCAIEGKYFEYVFDVIGILDTDKEVELVLSKLVKEMTINEKAVFSVLSYPPKLLQIAIPDYVGGDRLRPISVEIELCEIYPSLEHLKQIGYYELWKKINIQQSTKSNKELLAMALGTPDRYLNLFLSVDQFKIPEFVTQISLQKTEESFGEESCFEAEQVLRSLSFPSECLEELKRPTQMKIKLIITTLSYSEGALGFFIPLVIPSLEKFYADTKFGFVHTAVQIGPYLLEWNDSSMVVPRVVKSTNAIVALDLPHAPFSDKESLRKYLRIAAEVCTRWNRDEKYVNRNKNCHNFVEDLLSKLGVPMRFTGALQNFLDGIKNDAKFGIQFVKNSITYKFATHKELDIFVLKMRKHKDELLDQDRLTRDDEMLLKAFDRAFWMKFLNDKTDSNNKPSEDGNACACPWGHPNSTGTLLEQLE